MRNREAPNKWNNETTVTAIVVAGMNRPDEVPMNDDQRIADLYEVLKSYAPTPEARKTTQLFVSKRDTTSREILIELTGAIYNGIVYDNWPWEKA